MSMSLGQSVPQSLLLPTQPTPHSSSLPPAHRHQLLISQSHSSLTAGPPMSDGSSKLCLLVRHFPAWLNRDEKESLLRHFGAQDVFVMATKGKMRNCAFVTFANMEETKWALNKLHQLDVFGHRLSVEFAKPAHTRQMQEADMNKWACNRSKVSELVKVEDESQRLPKQEHTRYPSPSKPPPPESPQYLYPPPTSTTITNITNALASVPKLYVQTLIAKGQLCRPSSGLGVHGLYSSEDNEVLHLMNKMNLPPPFGQLTPTPPLPSQESLATQEIVRQDYQGSSGEDGSEIASDEDERAKKVKHTAPLRHAPKRRAVSYKQVKSLLPSLKKRRIEAESDKRGGPPTTLKKIELNIPTEITIRPEMAREAESVTYIKAEPDKTLPVSLSQAVDPIQIRATPRGSSVTQSPLAAAASTPSTGLGLEGGDKDTNIGPEGSVVLDEQEENGGEKFASFEELNSHKITESEMDEYSVFKKYSPGEPSMRLYIKNLARQVEEKDLRYIYGRYINWSSEKECNAFDIRVMQTGRMKGQAFIGLPSEEIAVQALKETNGYLLQGKPIAVHFARSTKAKDTAKS